MARASDADAVVYDRQLNVRIDATRDARLRSLQLTEKQDRSELVREAIDLLLAVRKVVRVRKKPRVLTEKD